MTTDYRTELANCPPQDAVAVSGTIYRGVANLPIVEKHFKSHNELGLRHCDESVCVKWGLSVWRSLEAVNNAQQLHDYMRRWYITAGELDAAEGVIVPTGNVGNPGHHTLWLEDGVSCASRFEVVQEPTATR